MRLLGGQIDEGGGFDRASPEVWPELYFHRLVFMGVLLEQPIENKFKNVEANLHQSIHVVQFSSTTP